MNLAQRYGLPKEGGIIHTEPLASRLLLEIGLLNKFHIPQEALSRGGAALKGILDATVPDYYVAALRFHGFRKEEDNGYAAIVMSKKVFTKADVVAKITELSSQMDITGASLDFVEVDHEKN
jgi:hypothetical protein